MVDTSGSVLVSTHDLKTAGALRAAFQEAGYTVELVTPGEDVSDVENPLLLVLTGGLKSEETATQARQAREEEKIPVFAVAGAGEEGARKVARALDLQEVFTHPPDPGEVVLLGRTLVERKRLQDLTGIVGQTDAVREALERVVQIAPVNATVLITGESGTGKELVARGIHALSPRKHKSFIPVNVAALSETLLESELFGHEKGAFTGAIDTRKGLFELAQGGTIFLDEIGEMPLATQTKLLRVLEEREFFRVGGEKPIRVDVRVIAATNQELRHLVEIGEFRRDLYFRLNVLRIELPPLRERREDIPLLVEEFVDEASDRHDRAFIGISRDAMEILESYDWPGNVRELKNLIESMVVLAPGRRIEARDIPDEVRNPRSRGMLPAPIQRPPSISRTDREEEGTSLRPELEFVFRTLVNLRMDIDDLRRDFQRYKEESQVQGREVRLVESPEDREGAFLAEILPDDLPGDVFRGDGPGEGEVGMRDSGPATRGRDEGRPSAGLPKEEGSEGEPPELPSGGSGIEEPEEEMDRVLYRPGMSMDEVEREAIRLALREVGGNRRRAAEQLGIGERTLYRKIRKYDLEE
jgi:transcriptional regulator with PAS, ATPase and Fis domain